MNDDMPALDRSFIPRLVLPEIGPALEAFDIRRLLELIQPERVGEFVLTHHELIQWMSDKAYEAMKQDRERFMHRG